MTQAPNSAGEASPRTIIPANACDAHCHILDPRFAPGAGTRPAGMTVADYRLLQQRIGTGRSVFVQAKYHGTDHACLRDALAQMNGKARGIAVVTPEVTDADLRELHAAGVRGLRFSVWNPADTIATIEMIEPLSHRIAPLGWHAQIHMSGEQIVAHAALLERLPCPIVIDHMGRLPPTTGTGHPAFATISRLIDLGRCWVKLSGAYLNTIDGPPYRDATRVAQAFTRLAPERLVWGSDWPHVTEQHKPDDAALIDLLEEWSGTDEIRTRILVDNPTVLYGF